MNPKISVTGHIGLWTHELAESTCHMSHPVNLRSKRYSTPGTEWNIRRSLLWLHCTKRLDILSNWNIFPPHRIIILTLDILDCPAVVNADCVATVIADPRGKKDRGAISIYPKYWAAAQVLKTKLLHSDVHVFNHTVSNANNNQMTCGAKDTQRFELGAYQLRQAMRGVPSLQFRLDFGACG